MVERRSWLTTGQLLDAVAVGQIQPRQKFQVKSKISGLVRRTLVETLLHGDRAELVVALDDTLLGLRPRPSSVLRVA